MLDAVHDDAFFESPLIECILYCDAEWQPAFDTYWAFACFHRELPEPNDVIFDGKRPSLLILDDLMDSINAFVAEIFTKISHHCHLSVLYVCQNLFDKSKYHRTISLNSHYIILLPNPRDTQPVAHLSHQVLGPDWRVRTDAYREATREQYNYLLFDLHLSTDEQLRLRTNIFPGEQSYSYIKKGSSARAVI